MGKFDHKSFQKYLKTWTEAEDYMTLRARQKYSNLEDVTYFGQVQEVEVEFDPVSGALVTWYCYLPDTEYGELISQVVTTEELLMQEDDYYVYLENLKKQMEEEERAEEEFRKAALWKSKEEQYQRLKKELGYE